MTYLDIMSWFNGGNPDIAMDEQRLQGMLACVSHSSLVQSEFCIASQSFDCHGIKPSVQISILILGQSQGEIRV